MRDSVVYCDSKPACMQEAGDIILADVSTIAVQYSTNEVIK